MFNRTFGYILVAALAAGLGLLAAFHFLGRDDAPAAPPLQAVTLLPQPRELPAFNLRQSDGTPLVPGELAGHWTLVFLGFTFCPDVCPTTLAELAQAQKQWEALPESTRPRVLFVSVDPERDTPEVLAEYLANFDPRITGLTGDPGEVARALEGFRASAERLPAEDGGYTMNHTAGVFLFDADGRFANIIDFHEDRAFALPKIRRLLE